MYWRSRWIGNPRWLPDVNIGSGPLLQARRYRRMTPAAPALIADIGATNARFALLEGSELAASQTYAVSDYGSPIEAARDFLEGPAKGHSPKRALIAAAGPVDQGRIALTNAAWIVDSERIAKGLGMSDVAVLNDFEALA